MLFTDWVVMLFTLGAIVAYGVYKGREKGSVSAYMQAGKRLPWYMVLLGVMATQASAITFLSAPGQAYYDGMRFVQYYFGLPLAMIVICVSFIPQYTKLNVITAYEFIEKRFDKRMRLLTAFLFLLSRGLSTGISIYAPAIVLSSILGIPLVAANFLTGGLLLVYTLSGGAQAIAHTQKLQFILILIFIIFTGIYLASNLPHHLTLNDALAYSRSAGKMNTVTTTFSWKDKYNMWSGIIGGFFLALSYFGTDQSQVARYVNAKDAGQSKTGLLLNGLVKIPMQFFILFIGVLLYVFYSFSTPPISYNTTAWAIFEKAEPAEARQWQAAYQSALSEKQHQQAQLLTSPSTAYQSYNAPITAL
ncbi:MAG: sodium:solute symporter, partial [Chitinophagia bacterium]|nr:sodium:solute symporter [Chitinophagia bacterium]